LSGRGGADPALFAFQKPNLIPQAALIRVLRQRICQTDDILRVDKSEYLAYIGNAEDVQCRPGPATLAQDWNFRTLNSDKAINAGPFIWIKALRSGFISLPGLLEQLIHDHLVELFHGPSPPKADLGPCRFGAGFPRLTHLGTKWDRHEGSAFGWALVLRPTVTFGRKKAGQCSHH